VLSFGGRGVHEAKEAICRENTSFVEHPTCTVRWCDLLDIYSSSGFAGKTARGCAFEMVK
jgi:hypothetical protein